MSTASHPRPVRRVREDMTVAAFDTPAFSAWRWAEESARREFKRAEHDREVADRAATAADRAEDRARRLRAWSVLWLEAGVEPATQRAADEAVACTACEGRGRYDDGWCDDCGATGVREVTDEDRAELLPRCPVAGCAGVSEDGRLCEDHRLEAL